MLLDAPMSWSANHTHTGIQAYTHTAFVTILVHVGGKPHRHRPPWGASTSDLGIRWAGKVPHNGKVRCITQTGTTLQVYVNRTLLD